MRNPKLIVYGSSYDRGLEHLLKMWPDIRKEVPEAELHIFYGWGLFAKFYADNPERMSWLEKMNKLMEQPGITHLGRISHEAVKQEMEKAGVWAYPTHFGEISCITAMKAQCYGAVPVVINYAALKETVKFGIQIEGDIYDQETKDLFQQALVEMLNHSEKQEEIRKVMMPWACEHFTWANVAKQWTEEFKTPLPLEQRLEDLLDHNQALKAWELAKGTKYEEKIKPLVAHVFDEKVYRDYYEKELIETPLPEELALDCTKFAPRFAWVVEDILKKGYKTMLDIGCADGYLALTLANKGLETTGLNLHEPSVILANLRASQKELPAQFIHTDFAKHEGQYDCVVMFEILEHLPEPVQALQKAISLVKPGGSLYLSTPRPDHVGVTTHIKNKYANPNRIKPWDDPRPAGHLRLWTEEEFKELLAPYNVKQFLVDGEKEMLVEVAK